MAEATALYDQYEIEFKNVVARERTIHSPCNFLFVRDFSTSPASLNGLAPMGVEDACARETRVATKAYDLWIATGNPDAKYNWC